MYSFTLVFRSACAPAVASRQLSLLELALANAGGELAEAMIGEYAVRGEYNRHKLTTIMEEAGFTLDRVITLTG